MTPAAAKLKLWRENPVEFVRDVFKVEPDEWQKDVLLAFPNNQRIVMKAPIALDAVVYTPEGERKWGNVQAGDTVFADDGSQTKVLERIDAGVQDVYSVTFRDGSNVEVCGEHLWKVQNTRDRALGRTRELSTKDILAAGLKQKTGQRKFNVPTQGAVEFDKAEQPLDAYVFGVWIGDGCRNDPTITCPDPAIRAAIESRGFKTSLKADMKSVRVLDSHKAFRATGINDLYCYEKYIPDAYKYASVEQRLDLLRGMMDADGTVALNGHTYYASSSIRLIDDIVWLARSLGFLANRLGPYASSGLDSYRAVITGAVCPFYADTTKRQRWRKPAEWRYTRYIDSIELVGQKEVMCIRVEHPSSCFLIGDFIVTHNCKGPGKSCVLAWLIWNFLITRPYPKIACTSVSADNLSDGLWTELAKWQQKSELLIKTFEWTKTRIFAKESPETWWCSARSWSKTADSSQQANTLAGLHADYMLFVLDEMGDYPDSVMAAAEAALASGIETKLLGAGNPTKTDGPLYRACTQERELWHVTEISADPDDPKRTPRVSAEWARDQIVKYGRDNPWVMVNVFGKFPPTSVNALLGPDDMAAVMGKHVDKMQYMHSPVVLGVDVARFGDDRTVIFPRQGIVAFEPVIMRGARSEEIAAKVAEQWDKHKASGCFIDNSGGWAVGVIDLLQKTRYSPVPVSFNGKPRDPRYRNKRAEMHFEAAEWVKAGGALPMVLELTKEATASQYFFHQDKFQLEDKTQVKERIGVSPDLWDAFVLTFASSVANTHRTMLDNLLSPVKHEYEYNPYEGM